MAMDDFPAVPSPRRTTFNCLSWLVVSSSESVIAAYTPPFNTVILRAHLRERYKARTRTLQSQFSKTEFCVHISRLRDGMHPRVPKRCLQAPVSLPPAEKRPRNESMHSLRGRKKNARGPKGKAPYQLEPERKDEQSGGISRQLRGKSAVLGKRHAYHRKRSADYRGERGRHGEKRRREESKINLCNRDQAKDLLDLHVKLQVPSVIYNPSLIKYLKSSSSDFEHVNLMMTLFVNAIFCESEQLRTRARIKIIPKLIANSGFLDALRNHLCSLPYKQRTNSVSFIEQICRLFECILTSGFDIASAVNSLPVDALCGTTRQLATQEVRFQPLHVKANEILEIRDQVRETLHNTIDTTFKNDVIVLPKKEELEQAISPVDLPRNIIKGEYASALQYLEIQYRLLREDFINPLRRAFHEKFSTIKVEKEEEGKDQAADVTVEEGEITEDAQLRAEDYVKIGNESYTSYECSAFEIHFQTKDDSHINWERSKRFTYGDLVCLINDDHSIILFATIADRNVEDLRRGIVTVDFKTEVDIKGLPRMRYRMIESPGFYAAYAPILRHLYTLQDKPDSLPFSRYIVKLEKEIQRPQYISEQNEYELDLHTVVCTQHESDESSCKTVNVLDKEAWDALPTPQLDDSQKTALYSALTQELCIIQGPPGTGKTYIGLKIVEALLQNRTSWDKTVKNTLAEASAKHSQANIVVVCYTNHALDQFLEGIIKRIGDTIPRGTRVRRIGGRSKSEVLKEYNISTFVKNHLKQRGDFGFQRKSNKQLRHKLDALEDLLRNRFDPNKVKAYALLIAPEIFQIHENPYSVWDPQELKRYRVSEFYSAEQAAIWLGLSPFPCSFTYLEAYIAHANRRTTEDEDDILEMFGIDNVNKFFSHLKVVAPLTEEQACELLEQERNKIEPYYVRQQLFKYCLQCYKEKLKERLKMGKEEEEQYDIQRKMATIECLKKADIIGVTTTGAARYNRLLSEIDAKIVIIEEAAEVLEAHTVSSLNRNTQHLILIGDHKQLRPKTTDHTLGRDYNLDVSLFERLIRNGLPHVTLHVQHRMRPEISALVSSFIYNNELIDAPSTKTFPPVAGVMHNVFFVDHCEPETSDDHLCSKANDFEAQFLARFCKYLLQQEAYSPTQITVITPYTGQMFNLRDKFEKLKMVDIKIIPIDSYQGEENDIILLSLVRSEQPGFVTRENRICVAMSRARHGLYVIGNFSQLFERTSKLWKSLINCMKQREQFANYLPVVCHRHTNKLTKVYRPEDFDFVSHGGCSLPCLTRLPCKHVCPCKCHPDPKNDFHKRIQCEEQCPRQCDQGHRCTKKCYECTRTYHGCGACEVIVEKIVPSCGHRQDVPCYVENLICQEPCTETLSCGHQCKAKCSEPHTVECLELVTKQCPKKHEGTAECYITYSRRCEAPCGEELMCGHICQGTCGECRQGRLHKPCKQKCARTRTCGHKCNSPCAQNCPPCKESCQMTCPHGPCGHKCWKQCSPCPHNCTRKCEHQECTRLCGELCDCPPCNKPCQEKLPCGHDCMGLCGEVCPNVCRICDKDSFNDKVPQIFLTEDLKESPDLKIIMLDCGHMYDVESLDQYYRQSDPDGKVQWKKCLHCNMPVLKTNRYKDKVLEISRDLNTLKNKEWMTMSEDERQSIRAELKSIFRKSSFCGRSNLMLSIITDRRLQSEYIIFYAEQIVAKCTADTDQELQSGHAEELNMAMNTLKAQAKDMVSKLEIYRTDEWISGQVLADIQAEQHRIQLLSAVIKVQAQIKTKNIPLESSEQEKLDEFMKNYEADRACRLKITEDIYKSSAQYLNELREKYPAITGLTQEEKQMINHALQAKPGSWYKCPNGHLYNIGECGGAMEESRCPECNSTIGGSSHRLHSDNSHAGEFDGSRHAAWSAGANMANYNFDDIQ